MNANRYNNFDRSRDSDDRDASAERWVENSLLASVPFDFYVLVALNVPRPATFDGSFWEVLNKGIAQKVHETVIVLFHVFLTLPPEQQKAFMLRDAQKMSFRDIGRILGVTHPTARKLYDQALEKFSDLSSGKNVTSCKLGHSGGTPVRNLSNFPKGKGPH